MVALIKGMIDSINEKQSQAINVVSKLIQLEVNRFCDKYRTRFWSGMGGCGFETRHGTKLTDYFVHCVGLGVHPRFQKTRAGLELAELLQVLDLKGHPNDNCSLGCYLTDYSP